MLYPFGWLPPDLQTPPQAKLPDTPSPLVSQPDSQITQVRAKGSLTQANRPKPVAPTPKLSLSRAKPVPTVAVAVATPTSTGSGGGVAPSTLPNLRLGNQGEAVKTLQTRLKALAFYPGAIDGIFGPLTQQAVQDFQQAEQLRVDGLVGPQTWQRLQAQPVSQIHPQPRPQGVASAPSVLPNRPIFTPAQLPPLKFHTIDIVSVNRGSTMLWIAVITVTGLGGAVLGFKPDIRTPKSVKPGLKSSTSKTIHHPQPIYPPQYRPQERQASATLKTEALMSEPGQSEAAPRWVLYKTPGLQILSTCVRPVPGPLRRLRDISLPFSMIFRNQKAVSS
ncbi:MAG: peptidoglycan-binding protein [Leptolyngbyaceae cyanobacterium SM2_3_12]|nr:peptidoglycan-binding protein [Leptolyngbyaceae cyanobacterium SM2_3_12]